MKTKFKDLLKGIFLTSVASLISSNEANAISYDLSRISGIGNPEATLRKSESSGQHTECITRPMGRR